MTDKHYLKSVKRETVIDCMNALEKQIPKNPTKHNIELCLQILQNVRKVKT